MTDNINKQIKQDCQIIYTSLVDRFVNLLTGHGKKSQGYELLFDSLALCRSKIFKSKHSQIETPSYAQLLIKAVDHVKPSVEIRKVRVAGSTYQVPAITHNRRQEGLAIRSLITCAFNRKRATKHSFSECLAQELLDSFKKEGQSRQKRDQMHNLAAANRAYARYRWW